MKELISLSNKYLSGEIDFLSFYYSALNFRDLNKPTICSNKIKEVINEWVNTIERARIEWGIETDPLSEEELKIWLKDKLNKLSA